jgi:hypothetical protein
MPATPIKNLVGCENSENEFARGKLFSFLRLFIYE